MHGRLKNKLRLPLESIEESSESKIHLSLGILNHSLGKILLPAQISLFHGPERAPLSILAHSFAISAVRGNDSICVFLDSGSNYSSMLARTFCSSSTESSDFLKRIIIGQVLGLDDLVDKIEQLQNMDQVSLVILDSLTGTLNLTGAPGEKGRQRTLFGALDSMRHLINCLDTHVMITDHSARNWGSGIQQPIGGNVLSHAVDSVILVDRLRPHDDVFRILIERTSISSPPPGVILRINTKGIHSIR